MQLHRQVSVLESLDPISIKTTLNQIIKDGRVTDSYQTFVLGWLSEFFKSGPKSIELLDGPFSYGSNSTSTEVVDAMRALTPENQVNLAQYLQACILAGENGPDGPQMSIADWSNYVLQRQE